MNEPHLASVRVEISGLVQGVSFRAFTVTVGERLGLTGYATNLPDGESVLVQAEGEKKKLRELIEHLGVGPPGARVREVKTEWAAYSGSFKDFSVR